MMANRNTVRAAPLFAWRSEQRMAVEHAIGAVLEQWCKRWLMMPAQAASVAAASTTPRPLQTLQPLQPLQAEVSRLDPKAPGRHFVNATQALEGFGSPMAVDGPGGAVTLDGLRSRASLNGSSGAATLDGLRRRASLDGSSGAATLDGLRSRASLDESSGAATLDGLRSQASLAHTDQRWQCLLVEGRACSFGWRFEGGMVLSRLHESLFAVPPQRLPQHKDAHDLSDQETLFPPLSRQAVLGAWQDWWTMLARRCSVADLEPSSLPAPAHAGVAWSGALDLCMPWCGGWLYLRLPRSAIGNLLADDLAGAAQPASSLSSGAKRGRQPALKTSVLQALARQSLDLKVELEPVRLTVGQLLHLKAGDVVSTAHLLDAPARVAVLCGQPLCLGWPGQMGGRRAIELTGAGGGDGSGGGGDGGSGVDVGRGLDADGIPIG
ncbi:MAG: FliM/FliN family flagellar motor C-terminal domain-containing protein [Janthinobacterium lividum]